MEEKKDKCKDCPLEDDPTCENYFCNDEDKPKD